MKIIYFGINHNNYVSAYYYNDLASAFKNNHEVYFYGPGHKGYDINDSLKDVIKKSDFNTNDIDLFFISNSWGNEDPNEIEFDFHPRINFKYTNVPKFFFLNKEYKKLQSKIDYINQNNFDIIFSVLHSSEVELFKNKLKNKVRYLPFAVNLNQFNFNNFIKSKKYDFSFTGSLHSEHSQIRENIKKKLFLNQKVDNLSNRYYIISNGIKKTFSNYNIYWAEWGAKNIFKINLVPNGKRYVELLNHSKVFLNTLSAFDILNPRFFELMAMKSLIFCNEGSLKYDILKNNINCVVFKNDLSDFEKNLKNVLNDYYNIGEITNNAYELALNNTYEHRLNDIINIL